jgi:biopolymer transport protein ExbD
MENPAPELNVTPLIDVLLVLLSPNDQSLERWFRSTRDEPQAPVVRIYPDKRAPYRRVAQVLAAAQRAHVQKLALDPVSD